MLWYCSWMFDISFSASLRMVLAYPSLYVSLDIGRVVRSPREETFFQQISPINLIHLLIKGSSGLPLDLVGPEQLKTFFHNQIFPHFLTEMLHHNLFATLLLLGGQSRLDKILPEVIELLFDVISICLEACDLWLSNMYT